MSHNSLFGLPGNQTLSQKLAETIRVNHAGEYGAKRIYEGQLAALGKHPVAPVVEHMKHQEQEHLDYFEDEMKKRQIRPSFLIPFWHVAGYAVGYLTARVSEKAAMACTVAVEEVINEHYLEQLATLPDEETTLKAKIEQFRQEELEHRDTGITHHAEQAPAYALLSQGIKLGSKLSIWLAKRF